MLRRLRYLSGLNFLSSRNRKLRGVIVKPHIQTAASHVHQSSHQIIDKPEPLFGDLTWSIWGVQRSLTPLRPPTNKQLWFLWNLPEATSPVMSPKKTSSSQLKKNNQNSVHENLPIDLIIWALHRHSWSDGKCTRLSSDLISLFRSSHF